MHTAKSYQFCNLTGTVTGTSVKKDVSDVERNVKKEP